MQYTLLPVNAIKSHLLLITFPTVYRDRSQRKL